MPLDNTLFLPGIFYDWTAMGTVEAALKSGKEAAERMMEDGL